MKRYYCKIIQGRNLATRGMGFQSFIKENALIALISLFENAGIADVIIRDNFTLIFSLKNTVHIY